MKENREESTCKSIEKKTGKKSRDENREEHRKEHINSYIIHTECLRYPKAPTPEILIDSTGRGRGRFYWPGAVSEALETPGAL